MKGIKISMKTGSYLASGCHGWLWINITMHREKKSLIVRGADYEKLETFSLTKDVNVGDVIAFEVVDMEQPSHTFEIQPMTNTEELLKEYRQLKQELEDAGLV